MKRYAVTTLLVAGLGPLVAAAPAARAASFTCAVAMKPDETAICGSMALSDLDVRMATLYGVATKLVAMGERGVLQDDQRRFLGERAACGADTACLTTLYQARIAVLDGVIGRIAANGPY
ncbi:lysozyme inhibitor LprI family protein [Segnochrobactrum spirostomi]|uniref:DUF1311 domain-containing protein n=1 Tax=Segnochrobactrum spirostomi TaxID=2608987 RepID=A0A6A7Y9Y2_9HYPH|nr:hypothetical protein [Segnochrobactrum spirostomi]MQT14462.1 hypothetical protein [Segnochrobactrum spirostomi]